MIAVPSLLRSAANGQSNAKSICDIRAIAEACEGVSSSLSICTWQEGVYGMTPVIETEQRSSDSLSAYGIARSTISGSPLSPSELKRTDAYWRACNYLALGMIYLQDNPLLKEPLKPEHIKNRLLGHWGSSPGLAFTYIHLNRLIKKFDLNMIFMAGPGHGAPGVLAPGYLEGTYSEIYPEKSEDERGLREFFKQFSFPGGIGSHCTPETPGSIHEGGELGYVLSHACGAAFDNPDLIVAAVVGDGEAETGPLATSWHISKFLNPGSRRRRSADPPPERIQNQQPHSSGPDHSRRVGGSSPRLRLDALLRRRIRSRQHAPGNGGDGGALRRGDPKRATANAGETGVARRPRWPMIVLRSPKGWGAPLEVGGHRVEGFWRAHQVPLTEVKKNPEQLQILEKWMRAQKPEELFDQNGKLIAELKELAPVGQRRMSANPHANGGVLKKALRLPPFSRLRRQG